MPANDISSLDILKEVIKIMKDEDLEEVCIEENEIKVQVRRPTSPVNIANQGAAILQEKKGEESPVEEKLPSDTIIITSPMVGIFYRSSSPGAEPFIHPGDEVKIGQVICIIEAMKLMNEIPSEHNGEIVEVLIDDGQAVEFDQPLFRIRPK
ncbi:acetyl-CoA carboxylase biotin carboxyl carrier protein [Candidatus Poribacteria bacterium]|nr:acetyl-CoA carboxylase biotin carboxyl carrier protein [Candidatus Poribacteria bacterium]